MFKKLIFLLIMKNKYDLAKIVFFTILFLLYLVYTIFGFIITINQYSQVKCDYLWIYSILSLITPVSMFLIQMCAIPHLFTDIKNICYFYSLMAIFGGISVFTCLDSSSIWIFALVSFILQLLVSLIPCCFRIYVFLCGLKTPCCCVNTDYLIEEENNNVEV